MIEQMLALKIPPGLYANGTKYQAKGRWYAANLVRFFEGAIQPVGGWTERELSGDEITGTVNSAISWQLADGTPFLAFGTTEALYVIDGSDEVHDITPDPAPNADTDNPLNWQLSVLGSYLIAVDSRTGDDESTVSVYVWTGDPDAPAVAAWSEDVGPSTSYSAFATPERFLVILRGADPNDMPERVGIDPDYSERRVYWASQETIDDFIPTDVNTGGSFDLTTDGKLIVGTGIRGQSLLWTDVDVWAMNYIGDQLVYAFQNVGKHCGIVSRRAYVTLDTGTFWMGNDKFFVYDGFVRALPCEVNDAVFGDFNHSLASKVWAFANPRYNEITWFYPALASTSTDRYVTYNYAEKHWTYGQLSREAGVTQRFGETTQVPVLFGGPHLFDHETGNDRHSAVVYLESGPVQLGEGDRLMRVQGIMPDDRTAGDVSLTFYRTMAPDEPEFAAGPYTLAAETSARFTARHIRLFLQEAQAANWRIGEIRLGVIPVERRGRLLATIPATITIAPPEDGDPVPVGGSTTFTAVVRNAAGQVIDVDIDSWESDDEDIFTVVDGVVTAHAAGTAHIIARIRGLVSNSYLLTAVLSVPFSIHITPTSHSIDAFWPPESPPAMVQYTAVVKDVDDNVLDVPVDGWSSDDEDHVTIGSDGLTTSIVDIVEPVEFLQVHITAFILDPPITSNTATITIAAAG